MGLIKLIILAAIVYFGWQYFTSPSGKAFVSDLTSKVQEVSPAK